MTLNYAKIKQEHQHQSLIAMATVSRRLSQGIGSGWCHLPFSSKTKIVVVWRGINATKDFFNLEHLSMFNLITGKVTHSAASNFDLHDATKDPAS